MQHVKRADEVPAVEVKAGIDTKQQVLISGEGTLRLNGANSCTGLITVGETSGDRRAVLSAGNTAGSANGSSTVLVEATGALAGTGSVSGVVTVNAGGELRPGDSIGTLTLESSPIMQGTYLCELNATNADRLNVEGTFTPGGTLEFSQLALPAAASYTILTADQINGEFASVVGLPSAYRLVYNATSIVLERGSTIYVRANATGADNGFNWANAHPNLQDALAAAVAGDEILIAAGTYYPDEGAGNTAGDRSATFPLVDGVTIRGGYPENGGNTSDPATHETILSGDLGKNDTHRDGPFTENSYHVVTCGSDVTANTLLEGLTIRAGFADGLANADKIGGGVVIDGGSPTFVRCIFARNQADLDGGGVYSSGSSSTSVSYTHLTLPTTSP